MDPACFGTWDFFAVIFGIIDHSKMEYIICFGRITTIPKWNDNFSQTYCIHFKFT